MQAPVLADGRTVRATFFGLVILGLTRPEAGNIVAHQLGLLPMAQGWTCRELEHVVWLRVLHRAGRWPTDSPARATTRSGRR